MNDEQVQTVESSTTGHTMTASESGDPLRNLTDDQRDTWLKTGDLPSDKKQTEASAAEKTDGDSTSKKAESSAAPRAEETAEVAEKKAAESATADEQEPEEKKFGAEAQKRIKSLDADNKALKARLAQLERPLAKAEPAGGDRKVSEKVEAKPEPKEEDFETTQQFINARIDWGIEEGLRKAEVSRQEAAQRTELETRQREAQDRLNKTFDSGRKKHTDFDEKALDPDLKIIEGSTFDRWLMDPKMTEETRAELMYHYGTHREDLDALNAMTPFDAARSLADLEKSFVKAPASSKADSKPAAEKKVSAAPPPGSEVGSKGSPTEDPRAKAIADGDAAAYIELENRREAARLGGSRK